MPEELNRVVTDHLSTLLLCSSQTGAENLAREGIVQGVHVIGDVMSDANRLARRIVEKDAVKFLKSVPVELCTADFGLLTLHRAENTDDPRRLREIIEGLNDVSMPLVFPIHPRTRLALKREGLSLGAHVYTCGPVGYLEMMALISRATVILTDSGGLQKEAYWARVPCITLRDETEWTETIAEGWNQLATGERIPAALAAVVAPGGHAGAYGDGRCAGKVARLLAGYS